MAKIFPFAAYRYTGIAGPPVALVTQPYDKIYPAMRKKYLDLSPYNLVRIILGEPKETDSPSDNVYTRAAAHLKEWIEGGVLARDKEPSLFAYFQEFRVPDTGQYLVRKGFVGLGQLEDYSANVVYRHEQTLSGPKKDRLELLRHTRAQFEQLFMLYPDPEGEIDAMLDAVSKEAPVMQVADEYGAEHRLWRMSDPGLIARIQQLMAPKKLLIADGHHRYETALAFRDENPGDVAASRVVMTFVNMHSPGLKILATHRLISDLPSFSEEDFLRRAGVGFKVERIESLEALTKRWQDSRQGECVIGAAVRGGLYALTARNPTSELDVPVLHKALIGGVLGISEEQVREGQHLRYIRGLGSAVEEVKSETAQIAFLLKPPSVQQVADISFGGGVMPQKSTDFYPKLLSGLTIYKFEP
ncbi:MAG TPA: DUF1015 domain-containing protein [Bryobacteraceae bacterium]|jgi:uncharacterized protein (DUF1015 family)|nr:DUF1015 domain-containing protein [Bryobacteraceae bacterium]